MHPGQQDSSGRLSAIGKEEVENSYSEIPHCLFQVGHPALLLLSNALTRGHSSTCSIVLCPFPWLALNVSAQTDAQTFLRLPTCTQSALTSVCSAHTHFKPRHWFCTTDASPKGLCTHPAPFMVSQAKCTPNANSLPVNWNEFMAAWPEAELFPIIRRREARGEWWGSQLSMHFHSPAWPPASDPERVKSISYSSYKTSASLRRVSQIPWDNSDMWWSP